ncbi:MAG: 3-methyladenine DNA glycosylase [Parcubacteria group bacterium CG11_big_fil_rev_8_21_14_0_20_39_22]|nr:MAG: 3-methyladenine DNA glycosylase [Parcubacteria group bacterium CG11_big_fil_rev_8_21_14_0_20_39_22]
MDKRLVLKKEFFNRGVLKVAPELIGKYLVIKNKNGEERSFTVVEVEAYDGEKDLACHSSKGRTERTKVMYESAGRFYVYLCYGMHYMLNIVTGEKDYPAAVLIRGIEGFNGPGKLTKALGIDKKFNGELCSKKTGLWFEDRGSRINKSKIKRTKRIGVDYAKDWAEKPYRFVYEIEEGEKI